VPIRCEGGRGGRGRARRWTLSLRKASGACKTRAYAEARLRRPGGCASVKNGRADKAGRGPMTSSIKGRAPKGERS